MTQSYGRRVPGAKKGAQMLLTAILTMGMFMTWEDSSITHRLYLVDADSGDVLWSDFFVRTGGSPKAKHVRLAIEKAFKALPERTTDASAATQATATHADST